MNLLRSLSSHQKYYLRGIARGFYVLTFDPDHNCYTSRFSTGEDLYTVISPSKPRGRRLMKSGNHMQSAIVELVQRKVLVDVNGRLVPSKEAAKVFGSPPPPAPAKRTVKMWRSRAAREQS